MATTEDLLWESKAVSFRQSLDRVLMHLVEMIARQAAISATKKFISETDMATAVLVAMNRLTAKSAKSSSSALTKEQLLKDIAELTADVEREIAK